MTRLRVGMLTTWNTRCGIAEYSRGLVSALRRRGDVDVTIFGSRNFGDRAVREYEQWATPVFDVQNWHPRMDYGLDVDAVLEHDVDVLHVQYSDGFYHRRHLLDLIRRFPGPLVLTYHDDDVPRTTFPHGMIDLLYTHREDVGVGDRRLIPLGIEYHPPVVKTFGIWQSRDDLIAEMCERNGWTFEASFGESRWLEAEELWRWLRDCDAIVLWYPERTQAGGSAAAPLALSTRRPVFVNDVLQFRNIPDEATNLVRVGDLEDLEVRLRRLFAEDYLAERSWDRLAATHAAAYAELVARRNGATARRRRTLRARVFAAADRKPFVPIKRRLLRQPPPSR